MTRTANAAAAKAAGMPKGSEPQRFRVLRPLRMSNSHSIQPGEVIELGKDWPFHRARQLTRQRYILPLDAEVTADTDDDEEMVSGQRDTAELGRWKRADLDHLATETGIEEPSSYPNKDALIEAMVAIPVDAPLNDDGGDAS